MREQLELSRTLGNEMEQIEGKLSESQGRLDKLMGQIMSKVDLVYSLQARIFENSIDVQTCAFYGSMLALVWFLTSFKTLRALRFRAFTLVSVSISVEKLTDLPSDHLRALLLLTMVALFLHQRATFVDFASETHRLTSRLVKETVEQTPLWFRNFKETYNQKRSFASPLKPKKLSFSTSSSTQSQSDTSTQCISHLVTKKKDTFLYQTPLLKAKSTAQRSFYHSA